MENFITRKFSVQQNKRPSTLNEEARSVDIVVATDTDEIRRYDWDLGRGVPEILIMSGCQFPESGQVPLLDSHDRYSVENVYGSVKNLRVEQNQLVGTAEYARGPKADNAFSLTRDGHLTDYSAGFRELEITKLKEGETKEIDGRTYSGPAVLITRWQLKEVSTCPIGADSKAKARSEQNSEQNKEGVMLIKNKPVEEENKRTEPDGQNLSVTQADIDKARAEAIEAERTRISEINEMCRTFDCSDIADTLVKENKTVDQARADVLDALKKRQKSNETNELNSRVEVIADEMDKFRAASEHGLAIRAGIKVEKPAPGANELAGYSLRELAREYITRSGGRPDRNAVKMIGRSLTTTDFPIILSNLANISLQAGWEGANETWREWCSTGSLNDFKIHSFAQTGAFDDLDEIPEHGEYKFGAFGEAKETVKIAKYGKRAAITREAIINDDLSALTDIPKKMGMSAARKIGDLPYSVLIANAKMGDNIALFAAGHNNLAGSGAALGVTPLNTAFAAMAKQKDLSGKKRLNIRPSFFLAPVSIMGTSEEFFKTDKIDNLDNNTRKTNIYSGEVLKRIYESRLDDDSETAWYLAAGQRGMTVKVFFLHGNDKPYLEQKEGWSVDGMEYKVRIEAAAAPLDFRGLYKNPGA
jgi:hypothetical protein